MCILNTLSSRFLVITMFYETNRVVFCNKLDDVGLVITAVLL